MRPHHLAVALAAIALAGCGGGGSSPGAPSAPSNPGGTGTSPSSSSRTVAVSIVVSGKTHTSIRQANGRRREYISPSTNGLDVKVFASGTTTLIGEVEADISSGSTDCGGTKGTPRTCTVYIPAPVGADDFVATTYDAAPVSNSFSAANELGIGKVTQTIKADVNNVLTIYIGGLIATLGYLAPNVSEPADTTSHDLAVILNPQDFDDNAITAGANDPYANPITLTLTETGGTGHAQFVLNGKAVGSTATLTESTDTLVVRYDGDGAPGYYAKIVAAATGVTSESFDLAPLFVTDASSQYSNGELTLDGPGSSSTLTIGETNGPATQYTVTPTACSGIATNSTPAAGENSSTTITAGNTAGTGCSFAISDGMSTITVAIDNTTTTTVVTVPGTTEGPISFDAPYTLGPIQGQQNWLSNSCGNNDYSASVVSTSTSPYSSAMWIGNNAPAQALQIDNSVTQGCFSGLGSPPTSNMSGYANALSDTSTTPPATCGPTCQPFFSEQFQVTSATGGYQPSLEMSISPVFDNQGARMSYLGMWHTQDPGGTDKLLIFTYDVEGVSPGSTAPCYQCANFVGYEVAYVDPTLPHLIGETITFVPPDSDVTKFYVDGTLMGLQQTSFRSWEDYYLDDTESDQNSQYPYSRAVNDLLFRPGNVDGCANFQDLNAAAGCGGTGPSDHLNNKGNGFLFDGITTCAGSESSCSASVTTSLVRGRHGAIERGTRKITIPRSVVMRL